MNGEFWETLKSVGDVLVPWVILPLLWYAWRIAEELREMRKEQVKDREDATRRFHAIELRQERFEADQHHAQTARDHNHAEILRRLDEITEALKGKADK